MTLGLEGTGMAVTMDIGNVNDIHPRNKLDVGKRLALWAMAKDYGADVVYSGPLYRSFPTAFAALSGTRANRIAPALPSTGLCSPP